MVNLLDNFEAYGSIIFIIFFCHSPDFPQKKRLRFIRYKICVRLWWVYCTTANWPTKCTRPNNKNVLLYIWMYKSLRFSSRVFFRQNFDGFLLSLSFFKKKYSFWLHLNDYRFFSYLSLMHLTDYSTNGNTKVLFHCRSCRL